MSPAPPHRLDTVRVVARGKKREAVAARVQEYADLGIDTFIFSGYPHLEESYRVAELLFPHLQLARPQQPEARGYVSPFGEMVANDILPKQQAAQS